LSVMSYEITDTQLISDPKCTKIAKLGEIPASGLGNIINTNFWDAQTDRQTHGQ